MTINWGTKIFMLYTGFVLLMGTLIWKSIHTEFDLVSEDYYKQEVAYQHRLDAQRAAAGMKLQPAVSLNTERIAISFPAAFRGKTIQAQVHLYNAANARLDKSFSDISTSDAVLVLNRAGISAAPFTLQLTWVCEGIRYYHEFPLNLAAQ